MDHEQTEKPNRDIHKENHSPVKVAHDHSAGDRTQHRADQGRNGDEAHGAHQIGFRERPDYSEPADGTIMDPPQPCRIRHTTRR